MGCERDYGKIIDLDNVFVSFCIGLYENQNMVTIINDGRIVNFEKEDET